jgi:hypothetical protein
MRIEKEIEKLRKPTPSRPSRLDKLAAGLVGK